MPGGVIVGDSGLCCYVPVIRVTLTDRALLIPLFVDSSILYYFFPSLFKKGKKEDIKGKQGGQAISLVSKSRSCKNGLPL